jgi:hypothetical protein
MPRALPPRPHLEHLDERLVPSAATVLDLTTPEAEAPLADGALVQQTDAQPTGTGYIRSFVRVQGASSGGGSEQGYNTDGRPLQFDEKSSAQFTRSLTLGQVPVVTVDGTEYREFLLDINQKSSSAILSLDEVRVFLGGAGDLTGYDATAKTLGGLSAVWDMDGEGDVSVKLDARLNSGSGSGDMLLLIPNSVFENEDPNSFLYLYSKFGGESWGTANGGFEEWAVRAAPPATPPSTGTASLSGRVLFDPNQDGIGGDEVGIAGVTIQLRIWTDGIYTVVGTTTTDANGFYQFTGLSAGTYEIVETQPATLADGTQLADGDDYLGMVNGSERGVAPDSGDVFTAIQLFDGEHGVEYNFTERLSVNPE